MAIKFPDIKEKLGLGVGFDLPWGDSFGFDLETNSPTQRVHRFLKRHREDFNYGFLSCHPKGRGQLEPHDYFEGFENFFSSAPNLEVRALHHTFLNLGAMEDYKKDEIIQFTNALVRRFDLKWINEDLGIWSINGKTLPYPLPPVLTPKGLHACVENILHYQDQLETPLLVEFPGFTDGTNFFIGKMNAYDFFCDLINQTESPVTLDTGHLISYQWLLGRRGEDLYSDLDRLPLEHCFEIHLSGCQIVQNRFMDFHHGIIQDEQIEILERLLPLCPNLRGITYEDPKFYADGSLISKADRNYKRLRKITDNWKTGVPS